MALELVAVAGMTALQDDPTVVCTIVVSTPTGTKCKAQAKLVHRDGDQVTVTAITVPTAGATIADTGPYTVGFEATATKTKAESIFVLREGDTSASITATPQIPGSPPTDYPVTFKIEVTVAGQTKAEAQ